MLSEDLIDLYDKLQEANDDAERAKHDDFEAGHTEESAKKTQLLIWKAEALHVDFWKRIHEKYGNWGRPMGVRDGYALVKISVKKHIKFMKKAIDNMIGEESNDDGNLASSGGFEVDE